MGRHVVLNIQRFIESDANIGDLMLATETSVVAVLISLTILLVNREPSPKRSCATLCAALVRGSC